MKNKTALFFSVCAMAIVFCAVYVALRYFETPLPKYYPTLHLWSVAKQGKEPGMGWYALFCAAMCAAAVAGGAAYAVLGEVVRDERRYPGYVRVFTWLTVAAVLCFVFFNVHHEYAGWFLKKQ